MTVDIYKNINKPELTRALKDRIKNEPRGEYGFWQNFTTHQRRGYDIGTAVGRQGRIKSKVDEQLKIIQDNNLDVNFIPGQVQNAHESKSPSGGMIPGNINAFNPLGMSEGDAELVEDAFGGNPNSLTEDEKLEFIKQNRERFNQLREENPDLGLKTIPELEEEIIAEDTKTLQEVEETAINRSWYGTMGMLSGEAVGYMRDPVALGTLAAPGGIAAGAVRKGGMTMLQAAIKAGKAEAVAASIPLAVNRPGEIKARIDAGFKPSTAQILTEVGAEVGFAAVGGGLLGALVGRFGRAKGGELHTAIRAEDEMIKIRNAKPEGVSMAEHLTNVDRSISRLHRGEDIEVAPGATPISVDRITNVEDIQTQSVIRARKLIDEDTTPLDRLTDEDLEVRNEFREFDVESTLLENLEVCMGRNQ